MSDVATDVPLISVVGIGTVGTMQVTREADAVLATASTLYVLHAQRLVLADLQRRYQGRVVDLADAYAEGKPRNQTYREIAQRVLDGARQGHPHVAYVTAGHPLVLVTPSQLIVEQAPTFGIRVQVIPGVSSLDTVWSDLRFDPGPAGAMMFEATVLLLRRYPLIPSVPLFLWQVNSVETALHSTRKARPERFHRLRDYLLSYYPPEHVARLVHSASFPISSGEIVDVALADLEQLADVATSQHILFVPPVHEQPVTDTEFRREIVSTEHLDRIVEGADQH